MNFLLDTTVLIDTLRSRNGRRALLAELVGQGHRLGTGAINIAEVYTGMRPGEEARTEAFLNSLQCYPMTCGIARLAGSLKGRYTREGVTLGLPDTIIAATALEHGLTLMTDNCRDFPMPELPMFDLPLGQ